MPVENSRDARVHTTTGIYKFLQKIKRIQNFCIIIVIKILSSRIIAKIACTPRKILYSPLQKGKEKKRKIDSVRTGQAEIIVRNRKKRPHLGAHPAFSRAWNSPDSPTSTSREEPKKNPESEIGVWRVTRESRRMHAGSAGPFSFGNTLVRVIVASRGRNAIFRALARAYQLFRPAVPRERCKGGLLSQYTFFCSRMAAEIL